MMAARGSLDVFDISLDQVRVPERVPRLLPLEEGKFFDLGGGRKVEVFHTPGHTLGEVVLIDDATRILFSGDACNPGLGIRETSVNTALTGLLKLKGLEHRFDRNFNGHIAYGSRNYHISMPETNLDDDIHILRSIIDGSAKVRTADSVAGQVSMVEYNGMQVQFIPGRIFDIDETSME